MAEPVSHDLSESSAYALLEQACVTDRLSADDATLLHIGSNAVYHLTAPVVVRISRQGTDIDQARRTIAVARWLESADYLAVRVVDVDQPIVINGHVVIKCAEVGDQGSLGPINLEDHGLA